MRYFSEGTLVQLRDHPMMIYRSRQNWPPQWQWISGPDKTASASGEVGILQNAQLSGVLGNIIFLTIENERGNRFTGHLQFDSQTFVEIILAVFLANIGRAIEEIAAIDLP